MGRLAAEREASSAEVAELQKEVRNLFATCLGGRLALCWWLCSSTVASLFNTIHIHVHMAFTSTTLELNWIGH